MAEDIFAKADFCTKTQIIRRTVEIELISCADELLLVLKTTVWLVFDLWRYEGIKVKNTVPNLQRTLRMVRVINNKVSPTPVVSGDKLRVVVAVAPK